MVLELVSAENHEGEEKEVSFYNQKINVIRIHKFFLARIDNKDNNKSYIFRTSLFKEPVDIDLRTKIVTLRTINTVYKFKVV